MTTIAFHRVHGHAHCCAGTLGSRHWHQRCLNESDVKPPALEAECIRLKRKPMRKLKLKRPRSNNQRVENQHTCEAACHATPGCGFVSIGSTLCALCKRCDLEEDVLVSSWSRHPIPNVLPPDLLNDEYSRALYGASGRVPSSTLRIVWLDLLPKAALEAIARVGACSKMNSGYPWRPLFSAIDLVANPHNALWISREWEWLGLPVPNHSWVEVTHCALSGNNGRQFGPMWLYAAAGSGVSIDVGRTIVTTYDDAIRLLNQVYPRRLKCLPCSAGGSSCDVGHLKRGDGRSNSTVAHTSSTCIQQFTVSSKDAVWDGQPRPGNYQRCWSLDQLAELDSIQILDHTERKRDPNSRP